MYASATYEVIGRQEITATDLQSEMDILDAQGVAYECLRVTLGEYPEKASAVFVPFHSRFGIAWGADAEWTDAKSIEEGLRRYTHGEITD